MKGRYKGACLGCGKKTFDRMKSKEPGVLLYVCRACQLKFSECAIAMRSTKFAKGVDNET